MVCNKFALRPRRPHYVCATFFPRPTSSYYMYVLTTTLLRPYCVLIPPRPRHVSFEHVQNLTKTSASIKTSLRPYYVPTTSYKTVPRPHYVLNFLGRSKDVVRTWPGVDVTLLNAFVHSILILFFIIHEAHNNCIKNAGLYNNPQTMKLKTTPIYVI